MKLGEDDSWDRITARKAAEAPVVVQAAAQRKKVSMVTIGLGLIAAALLMSTRKGKRQ